MLSEMKQKHANVLECRRKADVFLADMKERVARLKLARADVSQDWNSLYRVFVFFSECVQT